MVRRNHALIWWVESGYKDVIPLSTFPEKQRFVNAIANLTWKDHRNGMETKAQAKILAINEDAAALDKLLVSEEGEILDHGTKVFFKDAIQKKDIFDQKNKLKKNIIKSNKRQFEVQIKNKTSIVPQCQGSSVKKQCCWSAASNIKSPESPFNVSHQMSSGNDIFQPSTPKNALSVHNEPSFISPHMNDQRAIPVNLMDRIYASKENFPPTTPVSAGSGISKAVSLEPSQIISSSSNVITDEDDDFNLQENEKSSDENWDGAIKALAATIPGKVTERDIAFQEMLLAAMKYSYKLAHKNEKLSKIFELPAHFLQPAENMEEIYPKCGFYLPRNTVAYINSKVQSEAVEESEKWRFLVREVLLEVYGQTISNYSAKGKRGQRQPINPILFRGLFQWACQISRNVLQKEFIDYINKFASNKRRYQSSKASSSCNAGKLNSDSNVCRNEETNDREITTGANERPEAEKVTTLERTTWDSQREDCKDDASTRRAVPSGSNAPGYYHTKNVACYQPQLVTEFPSAIPLHQQGAYDSSRMLDSNRINWSQCLTPL